MLTKHAGDKIFSVFSCDEKVLNHYKVFQFNRKKKPDTPKILNSKDIIIPYRSKYSFI